MRVLILVGQAQGQERMADVRAVADALVARGHEVLLTEHGSIMSARATRAPIETRAGAVSGTLLGGMRLLRMIRKHRIQVVHAYGHQAHWWIRFVARLARAPMLQGVPPSESMTTPSTRDYDLPGIPAGEGGCDSFMDTGAVESLVSRLEREYRTAFVAFYRQEIPILCYHRLIENASECGKFDTYIHVDRFEQHLRYLQEHGYRTLHFADLNNAMVFGQGERAIILTFDDGYEDNYRVLFPLLIKYRVKAVIYLVSRRRTNEWDVVKGEQSLPLLNQSQRREMLASGLVEFGAHTTSHPDLTDVSPETVVQEIEMSKSDIEDDLGVGVATFAYPYGRLNDQIKRSVQRAGFRIGVATHSGPVAFHEDPFHVRRIVVLPNTTLHRFRRKVRGDYASIRFSRGML